MRSMEPLVYCTGEIHQQSNLLVAFGHQTCVGGED